MNTTSSARVIVGYDGSLAAATAIETGAALLPGAHVWITPRAGAAALRPSREAAPGVSG
jgi:hypothetical protein